MFNVDFSCQISWTLTGIYCSEGLKENQHDNRVLTQLWFVFSFSHQDNQAVNAAIINGVRSTCHKSFVTVLN